MKVTDRILEEEWMDRDDIEPSLHRSALRGLKRINLFSGTAKILANAIAQGLAPARETQASNDTLPKTSQPFRILDIACGGGDVSIQLAKRLGQLGIPCEIVGWDRSETALEIARAFAREKSLPIVFEKHDVLEDDFGSDFDVIYCTLFLHHLTESDSIRLMRKMYRSARKTCLIDDLRRTRFGLALAELACRVLTNSPVVRQDGPQSVRAAYADSEFLELAKKAQLPPPTIRHHWPQRLFMQWIKA